MNSLHDSEQRLVVPSDPKREHECEHSAVTAGGLVTPCGTTGRDLHHGHQIAGSSDPASTLHQPRLVSVASYLRAEGLCADPRNLNPGMGFRPQVGLSTHRLFSVLDRACSVYCHDILDDEFEEGDSDLELSADAYMEMRAALTALRDLQKRFETTIDLLRRGMVKP